MQKALADQQKLENDRNQEAILRLLDELSSLAQGDLTAQATVTEDITGAIADSVNYAVDAMRKLVTTINQSAIQLDGATRQTQALAQHLSKAAGAQSKQIASATDSTSSMAGSTEEVSGNAERAADVARHSVDVAHKGGDAVRRTIDGMNTIRETIQETSKRIKRLGESSQEIGNIVELINDIAEQTNILALNASIQASMAGEAGRGFAVVADEVQRLAERAANATKQIEVLVRTIQTDTNEAVCRWSAAPRTWSAARCSRRTRARRSRRSSRSPTRLRAWCRTSRRARAARPKLRRASRATCRCCARSARRPRIPPAPPSQSIGKLADLSSALRKSVAGFKLPGAHGGEAAGAGQTSSQTVLAPAAGSRKDPDASGLVKALGAVRG